MNVLEYPVLPNLRKCIAFWKAPSHVQVRVECAVLLVWVLLTGENGSAGRNVCPRDRRFVHLISHIERLGSNSDLHGERPATSRSIRSGAAARSADCSLLWPQNKQRLFSCMALPGRLLGAFAKLWKATISFIMSVRLSAWNNWAPTGRIFMKFEYFFEKLRKFNFH